MQAVSALSDPFTAANTIAAVLLGSCFAKNLLCKFGVSLHLAASFRSTLTVGSTGFWFHTSLSKESWCLCVNREYSNIMYDIITKNISIITEEQRQKGVGQLTIDLQGRVRFSCMLCLHLFTHTVLIFLFYHDEELSRCWTCHSDQVCILVVSVGIVVVLFYLKVGIE